MQLRSLNWPWSSQEWVAGSGYLLSTYNLLLQINLSAPQKYFFSIIHILHTILYFSLDFSEFQPCFISENLYFEFICIYDQLPNNNVPSKWSNKYIVIRLEMPSALIIWNFWINKILPFQLSSCRLPLNGWEDKSSDLKPQTFNLLNRLTGDLVPSHVRQTEMMFYELVQIFLNSGNVIVQGVCVIKSNTWSHPWTNS